MNGKCLSLLLCGLLTLLNGGYSWGQITEQRTSPLLEQLKFTAVELLIYTDQLQRFEGTHCRVSVSSNYNLTIARRQLLAQLKSEHRTEFEQLFNSAQVARLLTENRVGIEATLGPKRPMAGPSSLNPQQRAACQELAAVFQNNYLQTRADLQQLLDRYQQ
jgi:hypothetical protein